MSDGIIISVTPAHMRDGTGLNACRCPIALAMRDAGLTSINVMPDEILFSEPDALAIRIVVPGDDVVGFIEDFDRWWKRREDNRFFPPEPFSFVLGSDEGETP